MDIDERLATIEKDLKDQAVELEELFARYPGLKEKATVTIKDEHGVSVDEVINSMKLGIEKLQQFALESLSPEDSRWYKRFSDYIHVLDNDLRNRYPESVFPDIGVNTETGHITIIQDPSGNQIGIGTGLANDKDETS